ncbi:MAG: hypothetical protein IPQ03_05040 [Bacteroidetes bacterium]|nr:hypothetical protein [Bacteroidota bacterium]
MNENTGAVLAKRLSAYRQPEANALIPMMVFSPTIVNDGRRLMISPQPISYLVSHAKIPLFNLNQRLMKLNFASCFVNRMPIMSSSHPYCG